MLDQAVVSNVSGYLRQKKETIDDEELEQHIQEAIDELQAGQSAKAIDQLEREFDRLCDVQYDLQEPSIFPEFDDPDHREAETKYCMATIAMIEGWLKTLRTSAVS